MRVHLLHKHDQPKIDHTISLFQAAGCVVEPLASRSPVHVAELLDRADIERLVVSGGDGMIHHAVQSVATSGTAVGIVPAGTGNDIARALGIPGSIKKAVNQALVSPVPMDLIRIADDRNQSFVVSVLTAGFSGTVNEVANTIGWAGGQLKYTVATLRCLPRLQTASLSGLNDFQHFSLLAVGNTRFFGGGMNICPGADPTDGVAEAIVVDRVHPLHLAAVLPTAFFGQHVRSRKVHRVPLHGTTIETEAEWWADGEPLPQVGPVRVEVVPGALSISAQV
ncbi:MAG: diacylglycerol/lipid kinase family protein [Acidimicrobiales bacterium]